MRQINDWRIGRTQNDAIQGMAMDIYQDGMAPRFRALLEHQERQLRAMLRDPGETGRPAGHEVMDCKDIAMP